jgi:hypothetical protein
VAGARKSDDRTPLVAIEGNGLEITDCDLKTIAQLHGEPL